jgi:dTDP-4-dehydrorhamnose reductase
MKILILGANGQLGQAMTARLGGRHDRRPHADRARHYSGGRYAGALRSLRPQVVINCARANVDGAQDEPVGALAVNAWGRSTSCAPLVRSTPRSSTSTDFVFDGETTQPYRESDPPRPQGTGAVQAAGEWFTAELPRAYASSGESVRRRQRESSVDFLLKAIRDGKEARRFRIGASRPVTSMTSSRRRRPPRARCPPGLYHCVNSGLTTWFELAQELARLAGRPDAVITPVQNNAGLKTPRPLRRAINAKPASVGIAMPTWQDALDDASGVSRRYGTPFDPEPGSAHPLGTTTYADGVNFSIFSQPPPASSSCVRSCVGDRTGSTDSAGSV